MQIESKLASLNAEQQAVALEVIAALESDQLDLPTLPDMALKIRDLIDDPNVSADQVVTMLHADPVICSHIIKAANSAALSKGRQVEDLRSAVSCMGFRMLRNLVIAIAMGKLFQSGSPHINLQLKRLWDHSREVAANSYVLARQQRHLKPELALLAGLVHDIGALPLYIHIERHHPRFDQSLLEGLVLKLAAPVGELLLQRWHFPAELVEVPRGHENLQRTNDSGLADYVDVVMVANLQMPGTAKFVAWQNVSAVPRVGFDIAGCQNFLSDREEQLAAAKAMLGVN